MRSLVRPLAATVLVAVAGLIWAPAPALASTCSSDSGVTVVVDFKQLGGGIDTDCVPDESTAAKLFAAAGHSLENVQGQAFVCRVDGLPTQEQEACVRTPPSDAYWGLFWSDGESGTWSYSSAGAYSLDVPDGGSVAFAWQGSTSRQNPGVAPPKHAPAAEPSEPPTQEPSRPPSSGGGATSPSPSLSASASPDPSRSAQPSQQPTRRARPGDKTQDDADRQRARDRDRDEPATESPTVVPTPTASTSEVAEPPAGDDPGLPVWVGPTAVGGLLAVAGVATYLRRRTS